MQPSGHQPRTEYRADIDGLRSAAVIGVVLYHAFPNIESGGFVGVDVFFVISGYLITGIITAELDRAAGFDFADFYARRVRRIFPALIVVLAATLIVGTLIFLPSELASLTKTALASAFSCANLYLLWETGYFDIGADLKPLLHLWSLGIEEQFYLAWPLALWLTPRRARRLMLILVFVASFALNMALVDSHPAATFYLPFTRAWELVAGALLVGVTIKGAAWRQTFGVLAFVCGITFFIYQPHMSFPGWAAAVPVLGACFAILGQGSLFDRVLLSNPFAVAIGRISYPLYLWHWPLFVFARAYLFRPLTVLEMLLLIAAAIMLAWLTFHYVEQPIRRGRFGGVRTALTGMAAVVLGAIVAPHLPSPLPQEIATLVDIHPGSPEWRTGQCMLTDMTGNFTPDCTEAARPLIAVVGDSTAGALMPGLRELQARAHFGLAQFTLSSCEPLLVQGYAMTDACVRRNREIIDLLASTRPDTVILHALWVVAGPEELQPTIAALRAHGIERIIIVGRVPLWNGGLPDAVAAYYRRTGRLLPERTPLFVDPEDQRLMHYSEALGAEFVSAYRVFCDEAGCLDRIGNELVASDGIHLTPAGSKYLISHIAPELLDIRP
jgi:peptidoglycan/LPS O-acetylase OafA/YrhL